MENTVKTAIRCITFTQTVSYCCLAATGLYANSQALFLCNKSKYLGAQNLGGLHCNRALDWKKKSGQDPKLL